ncbi:MAG: hypothetical protein IKX18_06525 [Muribaculaceae bacterium]|nr:hypothetical protein [Muribaculaceae bacterium]
MKSNHSTLWRLLFVLLLAAPLFILTACGDDDDEPTTTIDYYLEVEEEFLVDGAVDHTDRYYSPVTLMKEAIRNAYPTPNAKGDDDAVIKACDNTYQRYLEMYTGKSEHLTCLVHLVRASKSGDIVKQSERIKTYLFDINPYDIEE